ncbi:fatty acid synthase [Actinobaculum suis]|uniref:Fatty acid synthase n=1 Tax=Actinobaculum suis TaxID=1657 RepID=A0A1G7ANJ3_9ACTO|nr:type I polyketide synthase [Actinobaculum suis]MDY5153380.1 type I polyketide synthase [Actinobaculum suis]SDE16439.1 fatty acid synthase [Actinobaculum suis]
MASVYDSLRTEASWILQFSGQGTPWGTELDALIADPEILRALTELDDQAEDLLAPVVPELALISAGRLDLLGRRGPASRGVAPHTSVPGILLFQYGAALDLDAQPKLAIGHSQGVLAAEILRAPAADRPAIFALARLIGAAASKVTAQAGMGPDGVSTPMLSVRGVPVKQLSALIDEFADIDLSIINTREACVVSGSPAALAGLIVEIEALAKRSVEDREAKRTGGEPLQPVTEFLNVAAPFHSHLLEPAVQLVDDWAQACGISVAGAEKLARAVLTDNLDWTEEFRNAVAEISGPEAGQDTHYVVDAGPGVALRKITRDNLAGTGLSYVDAATAEARDDLLTGDARVYTTADWSAFAPALREINGETYLDTAFSRLTGRSPVMLGGMTPTTVDPHIVAAAANAGYWTELGGGGQTSEAVLTKHLRDLQAELAPGRTAQFNAMFLDRYLWDLQFGGRRLVSRQRQGGAPLDGVTISAGVPELEEALQLINRLQAEGFAYVCFKPGTVDQIQQVVEIAKKNTGTPLIVQVEDGHGGGHHSWENLDDLLLATYADMREAGLVITVGGGLGTPERAKTYLTGQWSEQYGLARMPVDGIFIGTAAMTAKEAKTSEDVKQLLVDIPGVSAEDNGGWVAAGEVRGGITSSQSSLHADMYNVENSAAKAARLLLELDGKPEEIAARREEIITAINKTAKPYFGDIDEMTYVEALERYVELSYPWPDETVATRFHEFLQRAEARLAPADHGEIPTIFPEEAAACADPAASIARLAETYPEAREELVLPSDGAWFDALCNKYPKPVPFVATIDGQVLRNWGRDSLWQSQDPRYTADQVRIIPGPVSVAAITTKNEPVADILGRYETAAVAEVQAEGIQARPAFSRTSEDRDAYLRSVPFIVWHGHLATNPAALIAEAEIRDTPAGLEIYVPLDTAWDGTQTTQHVVREMRIPLVLPEDVHTGGLPVVDDARLIDSMRAVLAGMSGVGTTTIGGTPITEQPKMVDGVATFTFAVSPEIGNLHSGITAPGGRAPVTVPSALLGSCWPTIYSAMGSGEADGFPIIEGLLSGVHLDHSEKINVPVEKILGMGELTARSWVDSVKESSAGRVLAIRTDVSGTWEEDGEEVTGVVLEFQERFAMRGRATTTDLPEDPAPRGGVETEVIDTPRSTLRKVKVTAPSDMTAFAIVSGDYNPIHVSKRAAIVAGMEEPLVHGMWLCAAAQHAVSDPDAGRPPLRITGWTYRMFGMVDLNDEVEITVERTGRLPGGGLALEVTCRKGDEVVAQATATVAAPLTAYVYPGQGIQAKGMALDERADSPAARDIWERADKHTRATLGFSILALVRDNPTELVVRGETFRHPEGVLNLTQFTQVALATVAMAQTARLRERGALVRGAFFAGHSLGEYNALSAYSNVFSLEDVLEIVYHRGTTMHHLVERDEEGRSNYRMGALRPNQFGVDDAGVRDYVASIAEKTGEFLEIANYNLAGQQYAVAGTIAGLDALAKDAGARAKAAGGKRPFMLVPGIDVPFHTSRLRPGVPEFRETLLRIIPRDINLEVLEHRYVPNLVARPFELTREFCAAILEVAPSETARELLDNLEEKVAEDRVGVARALLVELLAWQFASPVRWIETQELLISSGVEEIVEVGLAASPTLANMAARTLALPAHATDEVRVFNVQRDAKLVLREDVATPAPEAAAETATAESDSAASAPETAAAETTAAASTAAATPATPADSAPAPAPAAPAASPAPSATAPAAAPAGGANGPAADIPFQASDAMMVLLAHETKVRLDQIGEADSVEVLTNGVSSKRNQILMDMTAEFDLASMDGAAEAKISDLATQVNEAAHSYRPFGSVLGEAINDRLRTLTGAAGAKPSRIADRVTGTWQLGAGWVTHVQAELLLGTREGKSTRGGELATLGSEAELAPTNAAGLDALIDAAVLAVGNAKGISVAIPQAGGGGGATVDSAVLDEFAAKMTTTLAENARDLLRRLGQEEPATLPEAGDDVALREAMAAELGTGWERFVTPAFDANKAVLLDDRWATAREDVAKIAFGREVTGNFAATGPEVARQARWQAARNPELAERFEQIAQAALSEEPGAYSGKIAVVTGMAPDSIAGAVAAGLLRGGATVVATASNISAARLIYAKQLYRENARGDAALWLVPANLASFRDIDALAEWIGNEQRETVGATTNLVKPALLPDLLVPFAAGKVSGYMTDAGPETENQARILLWGVERLIGKLAVIGEDSAVEHRMHVILAGSPNRGVFGGDGAYGEVKAALDAIPNKWKVEPWGQRTTIAHAKIGWVRGTGLMGGNDPLVEAVEAEGVRTWSTEEAGEELLTLFTPEAVAQATQAPLEKDMTGGLGAINLKEISEKAAAHSSAEAAQNALEAGAEPATIKALPRIVAPRQASAQTSEFAGTARPEDTIVIVGIGEVGPWGSSRTRFEAELGVQDDGDFELTPAGVLELAWMTNLLEWHDTPQPGWYDADGNLVPETDIYDRYKDEVVARSGIRAFVDDGPLQDIGTTDLAPVFLEKDVTYSAKNEAEARDMLAADPEFTRISVDENGEWQVTRLAGARVYMPRRTTLSRRVGGQFPTDFDPANWGIPQSMIEGVDRLAVYNLMTAVDAFISAGFSPAELLEYIHPVDVSSTQGTGFGGMTSMRRMFVERFVGGDVPNDILQEVLPNVVAAHTMQSYIGGYGSMIHPVGACATAAVSVEEGFDKIRTGKAQFVVAGGIDDVQIESLIGFGNMNATADSNAMAAKGINSRFYSRPGDRRRAGFVEGQGGGTVLLARGDLAQKMGLPVLAVVGYVRSFGDGIQTSIPAPGLGALAAGQGGTDSQLVKDLAALGVTPNDISVISKHDTSTNANDPNEAELHHRLFKAIGRSEGNPLYVVSQKSLTGHSKGGAALFQMAGLSEIFSAGTVPANKAVDCQDPAFYDKEFFVWPREPLHLGTVKASILTSLGFGHVSALMVLVHPAAFEASVERTYGREAADEWLHQANARLADGSRHLQAGMIGHEELYTETPVRFEGPSNDAEAALLLDPDARV